MRSIDLSLGNHTQDQQKKKLVEQNPVLHFHPSRFNCHLVWLWCPLFHFQRAASYHLVMFSLLFSPQTSALPNVTSNWNVGLWFCSQLLQLEHVFFSGRRRRKQLFFRKRMIQKILFKFSLTKTLIHYFFIHELHAGCLVKQPGRQPLVERVVKIYVCCVVADYGWWLLLRAVLNAFLINYILITLIRVGITNEMAWSLGWDDTVVIIVPAIY